MELRRIFWILDTKNSRALITKWAASTPNDADEIIEYVESMFKETSDQLAAAYWICKDISINPDEIKQALYICKQKKLDPMKQSPKELIRQYPDVKPKEKPINPDDVLTDRKDEGNGIVSYAARDEDREVLRQILNTHYGKDSSPWCLLQGDADGKLTSASERMWKRYSAYPKRVAFRNGKLLSFSAGTNPDVREWWDRYDRSFPFIPFEGKTWTGRDGSTYSIGKRGNVFKETEFMRGRLDTGYSEDIESTNSDITIDKQSHTVIIGGDIYDYTEENGMYKIDEPKLKAMLNKDLEYEGAVRKVSGRKEYLFNYVHGMKEGKCIRWYNGELESEMTFKNDRLNGVTKEYHDDGTLSSEVTYRNDKECGPFVEYYADGKVCMKGSHDGDGHYIGPFEEYHRNGQLERKCTYGEGGLLIGPCEAYYPNGQLYYKMNYGTDGNPQGEYVSYHGNGNIDYRYTYKNGEYDGLYESYYENGKLAVKCTYKEGTKDGPYEEYTSEGVIKEKCTYKDGVMVGRCLGYHDNGELECDYTYNDQGVLEGPFKTYYSDGQLNEEGTYCDDHYVGSYVRYRPDGSLLSKCTYNEHGRMVGRAEYYDGWNGELTRGVTYDENGRLNGPFEECYDNGQPYKRGTYKNGDRVGPYIEFYPNGNVRIRTNYDENGEIDGPLEYFSAEGVQEMNAEYRHGRLVAKLMDER